MDVDDVWHGGRGGGRGALSTVVQEDGRVAVWCVL